MGKDSKNIALEILIKQQKFTKYYDEDKNIFSDFANDVEQELNEFLLDKWIDYKRIDIIEAIKDMDEPQSIINGAVFEVEEVMDDEQIGSFTTDNMPDLLESVVDEIKNEFELERAGY